MNQSTKHILMIRPANFGYNIETAGNNEFQELVDDTDLGKKAVLEFNAMVSTLRDQGVRVNVVQDEKNSIKPDAIFPNNWLSTHSDGVLATWPMYAKNRRIERQDHIVEHIQDLYKVESVQNYIYHEQVEMFCEGTGSLVLDRVNKIAYACLSDRTHAVLVNEFCETNGLKSVVFHAMDQSKKAIYHTNVMMAIGTKVAVICSESILEEDRKQVLDSLKSTHDSIIDISFEQLNAFAGNMLEVLGNDNQRYMCMSKTAFDSLSLSQISKIKESCEILAFDISTIETTGGGSVRCMLCELFLEPK